MFQSVHSYEHLVQQFTEEHCDHKYDFSQTEFTHSHHDFDDCFVCEFSFSNYIPFEFFSFNFRSVHNTTESISFFVESPIVFSGSFFSLRGPPAFIV
ncbi:hypothetical protein [Flavobacterium sp.]|uniref:hypothetical protein n=1 Tax=Flavobacterium sp. TaxID=239 RepID=UPI0028BE8B06|nr:hypothetical protein [Flavobacterium sp.]